MSADDALRLAWQADRDGRSGRRDTLLTLAVALSGPEDAAWVGPCRDRLVARLPEHPFSGFASLEAALRDARVAACLRRLKRAFPPARLRALAFRAEVARGPFPPRAVPIAAILADLFPTLHAPRARRPRPAAAEPSPLEIRTAVYLTVLVAVAGVMAEAECDRSWAA